jgi:uncharacterized protein (DUF1810 family)
VERRESGAFGAYYVCVNETYPAVENATVRDRDLERYSSSCDYGFMTPDPDNLERFLTAQNNSGTYDRALAELRGGSKQSHWMWFVFPQMAGLGQSATSRMYAIATLYEARSYLRHPVLGPRLIQCAATVAGLKNRTAGQIFGGVDARKLHSSMTLFLRAAPGEPIFQQILDQYFDGKADSATDQLLVEQHPTG